MPATSRLIISAVVLITCVVAASCAGPLPGRSLGAFTRVPHDPAVFGEPAPFVLAISEAIPTGTGLLAVGWKAAQARFTPVVWRSADGLTWQRVWQASHVEGAHFGHRDHSDRPIMISEIGGS
jgi:hypothetical protein